MRLEYVGNDTIGHRMKHLSDAEGTMTLEEEDAILEEQPERICQFCKQACRKELSRHAGTIWQWECTTCPLRVVHKAMTDSPDDRSVQIFFSYRGKNYVYIRTNYSSEFCEMFNFNGPIILNIPHNANITPDNVVEKFSLYMTFS